MTEELRHRLKEVHFLRMAAHWGKKWAQENAFCDGRWPATDKEWRQTDHGAPWDTNVEMAKFHLTLAQQIKDKGLLHD